MKESGSCSVASAYEHVTGNQPVDPDVPKTYTVHGFWEIVKADVPEPELIWNGLRLSGGSVAEIIGPPGIGKSRATCNLALHQILGRDFAGCTTLHRPLTWLFAGSENDIFRHRHDLARFVLHCPPSAIKGKSEDELIQMATANGFSPRDIELLQAHFKTFTLEEPEDMDISLLTPGNHEKLTATLKCFRPDVLVVDPWGDVIAGKELDDHDVRSTISMLRHCLADAGLKNTLIIIVNHARMGAKEEAMARGSDEGNFGKNSKCLFGISRYVINVRRASTANTSDIELINAKNNDGVKKPPVAVHLNADSMTYEHMQGFDHDAWQRFLENAAKDGSGSGQSRRGSSPDKMLDDALKIVEAADLDGILGVEKFKEEMIKKGYNETQLRRFLKARREEACQDGKLVFQHELWDKGDGTVHAKPRNQHGVEFITTPEIRDAYLRRKHPASSLDVSCQHLTTSNN